MCCFCIENDTETETPKHRRSQKEKRKSCRKIFYHIRQSFSHNLMQRTANLVTLAKVGVRAMGMGGSVMGEDVEFEKEREKKGK